MALFNRRRNDEEAQQMSADTSAQSAISDTKNNIAVALSKLRKGGQTEAATGAGLSMPIGTEQIRAAYQELQK